MKLSNKITRFMEWDCYKFVDNGGSDTLHKIDWNTLQPVIAKISSMWNDTAELMHDYGMINTFNAIDAVDMLPHIEKCLDELLKRERSVYGCVYQITVDNVAKHTELAQAIANDQVSHSQVGNFVWIDQNGFVCSFLKTRESELLYDEQMSQYCADVGRDVLYGNTFEEIVAATITEMDEYIPSTVVNINKIYS